MSAFYHPSYFQHCVWIENPLNRMSWVNQAGSGAYFLLSQWVKYRNMFFTYWGELFRRRGGGVGALTLLAGSACCAFISPSAAFSLFQRVFELCCAILWMWGLISLGAMLQPPAPVTGWITHGSVQEAKATWGLRASKTTMKHFSSHLVKCPRVSSLVKGGQNVFL